MIKTIPSVSLEFVFWLAVPVAMLGTILNSFMVKSGFLFWILANIIFIYQAYRLGAKNQVLFFGFNFAAAVTGYMIWSFGGV